MTYIANCARPRVCRKTRPYDDDFFPLSVLLKNNLNLTCNDTNEAFDKAKTVDILVLLGVGFVHNEVMR